MTAFKLAFAVGALLGAGALAWSADAAAKAEVVARLKKAAAFIKQEAAAFVKFIGADREQAPKLEADDKPVTDAMQSDSWPRRDGRPAAGLEGFKT